MDWRFRSYKSYLQNKYGCSAYRIAVDGGFSCPNRKGDRRSEGCSYCDAWGSRSAIIGEEDRSITEQIDHTLAVVRKRYKAEVFMLYFQAYSSTYQSVDQLKNMYDNALKQCDFRELIVSTRPDCLDEEKVDLLASYRNERRDVWVELGLQSCHDQTLQRIRRGHDYACFQHAFELCRSRGLKLAVHLIFGLPGEDKAHIMESVEKVAALKPEGIKFHNLHIPSGSPLFREYKKGELSFPGNRRHLNYLADAVERIPEDTVVMRISTDTPGLRHEIPGYFINKSQFAQELNEILLNRKSRQGICCKIV